VTISDPLEAHGKQPAMVAHRIQDGNGQVPEALSADAVQRLLIGYGVALDTAAALPAFVQPGLPYCQTEPAVVGWHHIV